MQSRRTIHTIIFDFDGTFSTLRAGWEEVMFPFMKESIAGSRALTSAEETELEREIHDYIDQSTGIQTIYQMEWLRDKVREQGWNETVLNEWDYKNEYNRRLLVQVQERIKAIQDGACSPEGYLIKGSRQFLEFLHNRGIRMYLASGTDHPDVVNEADILGIKQYFTEIAGAPVGRAACSKEKVLRDLIEDKGVSPNEFAVIGDGKVEIQLGKKYGGLSIGLASDEKRREGINPQKERRLIPAGADWICGDFQELTWWQEHLGL